MIFTIIFFPYFNGIWRRKLTSVILMGARSVPVTSSQSRPYVGYVKLLAGLPTRLENPVRPVNIQSALNSQQSVS